MQNQLSIVFPILLIAVFYFLLIRPQKKREKEINNMRSNLTVGNQIISIGGIRGRIIKIKDDVITIEIGADKTKIEMMRWAISSVEDSIRTKAEKKVEDVKEMEVNSETIINLDKEKNDEE